MPRSTLILALAFTAFACGPTEEEGLSVLVSPPANLRGGEWIGPYLDDDLPTDPWGRDYIYVAPSGYSGDPVLATLGADGEPGGDGPAQDVIVGPGSPRASNGRGSTARGSRFCPRCRPCGARRSGSRRTSSWSERTARTE